MKNESVTCGHGHVHAEWNTEAVILKDGEPYAEIRSVEDGKRWVKGRAGNWSVKPKDPCQSVAG